jgi:hypothetical protein
LDVDIVTYLVPLFSTTHPRFGEFSQIQDLSHFLNNTSSPKLFLLLTETVANALSLTLLGYILGNFSGPKVCTVFFSQKHWSFWSATYNKHRLQNRSGWVVPKSIPWLGKRNQKKSLGRLFIGGAHFFPEARNQYLCWWVGRRVGNFYIKAHHQLFRSIDVYEMTVHTAGRGFESRQGVRFLGVHVYIATLFYICNFVRIAIVRVRVK